MNTKCIHEQINYGLILHGEDDQVIQRCSQQIYCRVHREPQVLLYFTPSAYNRI